jgi:hypothetical protein
LLLAFLSTKHTHTKQDTNIDTEHNTNM